MSADNSADNSAVPGINELALNFAFWIRSEQKADEMPDFSPEMFGAHALMTLCGARPGFSFTFPAKWRDPPSDMGAGLKVHRVGDKVLYTAPGAELAGSPFSEPKDMGKALGYVQPLSDHARLTAGQAYAVEWWFIEHSGKTVDDSLKLVAWTEVVLKTEAFAQAAAKLRAANELLRPHGWLLAFTVYDHDLRDIGHCKCSDCE